MPPLAEKCIESWKRYCPDYEIKEWNERNFDVNYNEFVKQAYEAEKWAFVSDVARLYATYTEGGIYMDTDCELLKPIDEFLGLDAFSGFESPKLVPTAIMGSRKGHELFKELLDDYETRLFKLDNREYDMTPNTVTITNLLLERGLVLNNKLQNVANFTIYPTEYFCPQMSERGAFKFGENTYATHHFASSWIDKEGRKIGMKLEKIFGARIGRKLYNFSYVYRTCGVRGVCNKIRGKE
ncbi:MAG: glycosyl transferase [Oscillospiraceae bacterium]|nr:glycosyl transferase [Oscillospiraceae bacterium]